LDPALRQVLVAVDALLVLAISILVEVVTKSLRHLEPLNVFVGLDLSWSRSGRGCAFTSEVANLTAVEASLVLTLPLASSLCTPKGVSFLLIVSVVDGELVLDALACGLELSS
jgi:hypothetical protein